MILNFCRSCRGSIAVMGAALLGLAVLGTGAAIDFARISAVKGELKRAADAGALAAARMADGAMAEDAATGMVDLTLRDVRGMMDVLDRSYHRQGAEHVVSLTASIRLLVLGVLGDAAMRVGVEAAAVSGDAAGAGQGETAPCLHLGSGPGRMALIVEDGASIVGDGCLLVLASDDPNLVSVDGGALDIAGFCVDGEADPTRLAILSTRLGLPHLPAGCAPIGRTLPPWDGSCRNYDKARDRRHEGEMEYSIRGGTYCGNTHIHKIVTNTGSPERRSKSSTDRSAGPRIRSTSTTTPSSPGAGRAVSACWLSGTDICARRWTDPMPVSRSSWNRPNRCGSTSPRTSS